MPGATPLDLSALLFPPTAAGLKERILWQASVFAGTTDWLTLAAVKAEAALQAVVWQKSDLAAGLSKVTIPALVISGADDVVFPRERESAGCPIAAPDAARTCGRGLRSNHTGRAGRCGRD